MRIDANFRAHKIMEVTIIETEENDSEEENNLYMLNDSGEESGLESSESDSQEDQLTTDDEDNQEDTCRCEFAL